MRDSSRSRGRVLDDLLRLLRMKKRGNERNVLFKYFCVPSPYITVTRFSRGAHETALLVAVRESGHDVIWFAEIGVTAVTRFRAPERPEVQCGAAAAVTWSAANRIKTTRKGPIIATRLRARVYVASCSPRGTRGSHERVSGPDWVLRS